MPPPTPPSPTLSQLDRALRSQHERRVALCSEYSNLQRARKVEDKALAAKRKGENEALARELERIGREQMRLQNERVRIECGLSRGDMEGLMAYSGNGNTVMPSPDITATATAASSMTGSDAEMIVPLQIPEPKSEQDEVVQRKAPTQHGTGSSQAGEANQDSGQSNPHPHSGFQAIVRGGREQITAEIPVKKRSGVEKTTRENSISSRKRSYSQHRLSSTGKVLSHPRSSAKCESASLPLLKEDGELVKRRAVGEKKEEGDVNGSVMYEDKIRDNNLAKGDEVHEDGDLFWSDCSALSSPRTVPSPPNWSPFWDMLRN
ncbi:hypothetical protein FQN50_009961 [Emmonsiellopsis sp. PD_5]|nr:hypothetical protein FQN50_009961 [Emmonsiellopsis sp. PD_5]